MADPFTEKEKEKWEEFNKLNQFGSVKRATHILTVKNTLQLIKDKNEGLVLDVGCGFGEIDTLLAKSTNFKIIGCDISPTAVKAAQNNVKIAQLEDRVTIEEGNVYNLKYPDNYFDIVVSFGYASAATYPGAQKEVARILKPGGILVCDFINRLSIYKFLNTLKRVSTGSKAYYITLNGICKEFEKYGLYFLAQRFFNTYPPIDFKIGPNIFLVFENTVGRILNRALGRVRLVVFQKQ